MNGSIQVAIITAAASIIVAAVSFILTTRQKRSDELRQRKMEHYRELLSSISDLAVKGLSDETQARYATASNTIALIASQKVIAALDEFQQEIAISNPKRSLVRHDELLTKLVLELRRSLELPFERDVSTFRFRLVVGGRQDN